MSLHTYKRIHRIDEDPNDSLSLIYSKITSESVVLDVGAGVGTLGEALIARKSCQVYALTHNIEEHAALRETHSDAYLCDLEREPLPAKAAERRYDYIVCADVLEHLRNAEQVLAALLPLLTKKGLVLVSVPNVTYAGVLAVLIGGRFPRTLEGLLDKTHVHFFDRQSLQQLCKNCEAKVVTEDAVRKPIGLSEYAGVNFHDLPLGVRQYLEHRPDADIYQHVWALSPSHAGAKDSTGERPREAADSIQLQPAFNVSVYFDYGSGFTEAEKTSATAQIDGQSHTLVFPSPKGAAPCRAIRVDWPSAPALLILQNLAGESDDGAPAWSWNGSWSEQVVSSGVAYSPISLGYQGVVVDVYHEQACSVLNFDEARKFGRVLLQVVAENRNRYASTVNDRQINSAIEPLIADSRSLLARMESIGRFSQVYDLQKELHQFLPSRIEAIVQRITSTDQHAEQQKSLVRELNSFVAGKVSSIEQASQLLSTEIQNEKAHLLELKQYLPTRLAEQASTLEAIAHELARQKSLSDELFNFLPPKISQINDQLWELTASTRLLDSIQAIHSALEQRQLQWIEENTKLAQSLEKITAHHLQMASNISATEMKLLEVRRQLESDGPIASLLNRNHQHQIATIALLRENMISIASELSKLEASFNQGGLRFNEFTERLETKLVALESKIDALGFRARIRRSISLIRYKIGLGSK